MISHIMPDGSLSREGCAEKGNGGAASIIFANRLCKALPGEWMAHEASQTREAAMAKFIWNVKICGEFFARFD